jgi:hypothetical protein
MSITAKREAVKGAYGGNKWRQRVNNMPDEQIIAIYQNLKNQNKV